MKTIKELAQEAIDVQNACNLPGVLLSFHHASLNLRALMPAAGAGTIQAHPIMRAWCSKICDMTGNYSGAYPADELAELLKAPTAPAVTPTLGPCSCRKGQARDNCPECEGTGRRIDFVAFRARPLASPESIRREARERA